MEESTQSKELGVYWNFDSFGIPHNVHNYVLNSTYTSVLILIYLMTNLSA